MISLKISSKLDYANERHWECKRLAEKLRPSKHFHETHKGKLTRKAVRLLYLEDMAKYWERETWRYDRLPLFMKKEFGFLKELEEEAERIREEYLS